MTPRLHITLALGALALTLGIAVRTANESPRIQAALARDTIDIGIEHAGPLSVQFEYASRSTSALVRIAHNSSNPISVSVPESWERTEVTGAPLADFRRDDSVFGFIRWHFPAQSGVLFTVKQVPEHIVIHNPAKDALKLIATKVNLEDESIVKDIFLIQDSAVRIW